ncbi:MAG: hypothetical protein FIB06_01520 [Betaproteobacteria bacterium]|nr:hypothetical protein [Betaproteobacteria bacterium]
MRLSKPFIWYFLLAALVGAAFVGKAHAAEHFSEKVSIGPGLVAVVSEGEFEARSVGSYSVRVYFDSSGQPGNETTFYAAGLIRARDGTVRSIAPLQVAGRKRPVLMVVVESAGSGGYLSADAFAVEPRAVRLLASVSGLAPSDDPAAKLSRKLEGMGKCHLTPRQNEPCRTTR